MRDNKPLEVPGDGGLNRREFLSAFGAASITGAFLAGTAAGGDETSVWYYDSYGTVVPANPAAIAVGVYPPPLPAGAQPPSSPDEARRHSRGSRMAPADAPPAPPPNTFTQYNILLIMVDQIRQEKWFPAGGEAAIFDLLPNLNNLRNSSFVFGNHFTAAAKCTPARATLLTGLYAPQTCMFRTVDTPNTPPKGPNLQTGYNTIGNVLSSAGYGCTWIGKWHLSADPGAGSGDTGFNGPSDYGFGKLKLDIPNLSFRHAAKRLPLQQHLRFA